MANTLLNTQIITDIALAKFVTNNSMLLTANRGYQSDFKNNTYQKGDTVNIRKQNHFIIGDGRIATLQDVIEESVPLTIDHQLHAALPFNSKELTLDVTTATDRFVERYIAPIMQDIQYQMEVILAQAAITSLNFAAGSAASPVNSFDAVDLTGAKMLEQGMPIVQKAYMALSIRDASALKSSLQPSFNRTLNEDITFDSALGHLSYFDIFQNQAIARHTTGSLAGSPVVNGTVTSGNTIVLDGATASATQVFTAGDVVTFAGVNSVNPIGRTDTGQLMQFVVLADADADGAGNVTITVAPSIISDLSNPRRNVTVPIPDNAAVNIFGVTVPGTPVTYNVNTAYSPRGLDIAMPPLDPLYNKESWVSTDEDYNVSVRITLDADTLNDVNMVRADVLFGQLWHQQYAAKLISQAN